VDYTSTPITATFPAGDTTTIINVAVTIDTIAEQSETFDLGLTIPPAISGDVILGNIGMAVGNITDATSKIIVYCLRELFS